MVGVFALSLPLAWLVFVGQKYSAASAGRGGRGPADRGGGGVLVGSTSRRGFGRWAVVGIGVGGFPGCGASQRRSRD